MGIMGSKDSNKNASGQSGRRAQQAQTKNQVQAATVAGRGRRRIGGGTSTRQRPSQTF
jgi:hypothetical protein